jgi:transposase
VVLASHVIHTDDTSVKIRDAWRKEKHTGHFWPYVGDPLHPLAEDKILAKYLKPDLLIVDDMGTEKETVKLSELLQYNLQSIRSYLLREDFQRFWEYRSPGWSVKFLEEWCVRTMRSKIKPMKKIARTLREHRDLILNWFRAKGTISAGSVEGLNNKAKLTTRKAYGFRTYEAIEIALYHTLGDLPEPNFTHEF